MAVLTGGARARQGQHRRQSSYAAPSSDYGVPAGPVIGGGGSSAPSSGYGVPAGPIISGGGSRPQPSKPSYNAPSGGGGGFGLPSFPKPSLPSLPKPDFGGLLAKLNPFTKLNKLKGLLPKPGGGGGGRPSYNAPNGGGGGIGLPSFPKPSLPSFPKPDFGGLLAKLNPLNKLNKLKGLIPKPGGGGGRPSYNAPSGGGGGIGLPSLPKPSLPSLPKPDLGGLLAKLNPLNKLNKLKGLIPKPGGGGRPSYNAPSGGGGGIGLPSFPKPSLPSFGGGPDILGGIISAKKALLSLPLSVVGGILKAKGGLLSAKGELLAGLAASLTKGNNGGGNGGKIFQQFKMFTYHFINQVPMAPRQTPMVLLAGQCPPLVIPMAPLTRAMVSPSPLLSPVLEEARVTAPPLLPSSPVPAMDQAQL